MVSKFLTALAVASVASAAGTNVAKFNAYWGQSGPADERLRDRCDEGADYISLSFVTTSPEHDPTGVYPGIGFAAHCWAGGYMHNNVESGLLTYCRTIIEDLQYCRNKGIKMLLSIGGVWNPTTANYKLSSEQKGREFADFLWGAFGPYKSSWGDRPRPFEGVDATTHNTAIDGFDFDLEIPKENGKYYDNGPWIAMIDQLRSHSKDIIITGAPQCPTNPDWFGMKDMIQKAQFDALFIQFYNNVGCDLIPGNDPTDPHDDFNYMTWEKIIAASDKSKNAKLFVGLPAAPDHSNSQDAYVEPSALEHIICPIAKRPSFGGISLWDMWSGKNNVVNGKSYNQHVQDILSKCGAHTTTTTTTTTTTKTTTSTTSSSTTTTTTTTSTSSSSSSTTTSSSITTPTSTSTSSTSTSSTTSSQPTSSSSSSTSSAAPTSSSSSSSSAAPTSSSSSTSSAAPTSSSSSSSSSAVPTSESSSSSSAAPTSSSSSSSSSSAAPTSESSSSSAAPTSSSSSSSSAIPTSESSSSSAAPTSSSSSSSSSAVPTSETSSSSAAPTSSSSSTSSAAPTSSSSSSAAPTSESSSSSAVPTSSSSSAVPTSISSSSSVITTTGPVTTAPTTTSTWNNATTTSEEMTTSTVFTTTTYTITSCAPTVTNCPARVTTETIALYTTVCPVTKTNQPPQTTSAPSQPPAEEMTTSTVYTTTTYTISKCPPSVTNCPIGHVTTETISVSTTVCPVTKTNEVPKPTQPAGSESMTTTTLHNTMTVTKTLVVTGPSKVETIAKPSVSPSQPAGNKCPGGPNCPPPGTGAPSAPIVKPTTPVVTGGASSIAAGLVALVAAQIFLL